MPPAKVRAFDRLVTGDGPFGIIECRACEFGLTLPQLSDEKLGRYYAGNYYESFYEHSDRDGGSPLRRLRSELAARGAARRYRRPPFALNGLAPGRILDVGCGSGDLLAHFAECGWRTYGIEPSEAAAGAAARRGAKVHQGTLQDQPWDAGSFQLIVFQHSLEHIGNPLDAVERAQRLLSPGGTLIVTVPNWSSWQRRAFGNRWAMLDVPRHLQHFSPQALTQLAAKLDLELEEVGTSSNAIAAAYSVHYLIAGRWTPGWKLWLSYALSLPLLPFVFLGDRIGGGDSCYVLMRDA